MKKHVGLFALVLVILVALPLMYSCGEEGNAGEISDGSIPYPITEYTVIRPEKASDAVTEAAASLSKHINGLLTDAEITLTDDCVKGGIVTDEVATAKEILIGSTT